jgi:hypothetical protein
MRRVRVAPLLALAVLSVAACSAMRSENPMSFFVTSVGSGQGANFGGLEGADRHCQTLAAAAGAGGRTWHAYLSTDAGGGTPGVDARDRIGNGPWRNAKGEVIASSIEDLHSANNKLSKQTALTEKGGIVNGRGDTPNTHDILTGSMPDGRVAAGMTCANWTSNADTDKTIVGHVDRSGLDDSAAAKSWNSSHPTKGCSQPALVSTGGAGLLYCFAVN